MASRMRVNMWRRTALVAALIGAFGSASEAEGQTMTVDEPTDISGESHGAIEVVQGGVLTGQGAEVSGEAYDLLLASPGGQITLDDLTVTNDLDSATGQNGRAVSAKGSGASVTLNNATIGITAFSTNDGVDYAHAFTAGVGAADGGSVVLNGGTVNAAGSKRTVGIQANDGGSIQANGVSITTNDHFGHAVVAYRTPALDEILTRIDLDSVSIETLGASYAVGIQVANKGAEVAAVDSSITTHGEGSFGAEVFNGAALSYQGGSIETEGDGAAGVRVYGGASFGAGSATLEGTRIETQGDGAAGVVAGDSAEPMKGMLSLTDVSITTHGANASGLSSAYESEVASTGSTVLVQGAGSHGAVAQQGGSISLSGDTLSIQGNNAYGLYAQGLGSSIEADDATVQTYGLYGFGARAEAGGAIAISGGSIATENAKGRGAQDGDGSRAYALSADGDGSSITVRDGTVIATQGQRAYGAYATGGGYIKLQDASVATHGFMAYGLYASGAGSKVEADNVTLRTSGSVGDGVWAYQGGEVSLAGGSIDVGGQPNANSPYETANGLVAAGGEGGTAGGLIHATDMTIVTRGADSVGAMAGGLVGSSGTAGTIELEGTSLSVLGENAVAAGVSYGGVFSAQGSTLVSGKGDGIVITDNGTVTLTDTRLDAAGASLVSNLESAGQTQDILVGSGSDLTRNNGTLLQVNRNEAGMDGTVNLTLAAGSVAYGDIVDLDGLTESGSSRTGNTNFTVQAGAQWSGAIRGINDATTEAGGEFIDNGGAPIDGNVVGGEGSTIAFTNGATIGGGVSVAQGGSATFQGNTSIGGNVSGFGASMTFSGPADIGSSVVSTGDSTLSFQGPTVIGQNVSGSDGTSVVFGNSATIGGDVVGSNTAFSFSPTYGASIGGNVVLDSGSSLSGGSRDATIQIEGDVSAGTSSVLGGNLDVKGTVHAAGATISPGNSVGVQTYGSIASFGSTYKAEVNAAGVSDLVIATTGDVDISATHLTVAQENGNGGYRVGHDYRILQTVGGNVVGTFASSALDQSFANTLVSLDPVKYDPKDVFVSLSIDQGKVSAARQGLTANQRSTLDGALSVAGLNGAADAAMTSTDTAGALDQLSGEVHASVQSALLQGSGAVRRAIGQQVESGSGTGPSLWAQVLDGSSTLGIGKSGVAEAKTTQGGLFVGGDGEVFRGWRIGAALGYVDGQTKVDDRSSRADAKSYTAALYGTKNWALTNGDGVSLLAGTAYTHHDLDTHRDVTLDGGQTLKADYGGRTAQVFSELGYGFRVGPNAQLTPYVGLAWINQKLDGFHEKGGSAALQGDARTDDILTSSVGVRGQTSLEVFDVQAQIRGGLAWIHASGDVDPSRGVAFAEGGGTSFRVAGAPLARDSAAVDLGAQVQVGKAVSVGLGYNGQFGGGLREHGASLYLKAAF